MRTICVCLEPLKDQIDCNEYNRERLLDVANLKLVGKLSCYLTAHVYLRETASTEYFMVRGHTHNLPLDHKIVHALLTLKAPSVSPPAPP